MNYKLLSDPHFTQKLFDILLLLYTVCWVVFLLVVLWCGLLFVWFFGGEDWGNMWGLCGFFFCLFFPLPSLQVWNGVFKLNFVVYFVM